MSRYICTGAHLEQEFLRLSYLNAGVLSEGNGCVLTITTKLYSSGEILVLDKLLQLLISVS